MQTNTNTAAIDAASTKTTSTRATSAKPVTYTNEPNAVVVRITGRAFENLRRIADTMNAVSWTENDHTPAWAVQYWVGDFLDRLAETQKTCDYANVTEVAEDIILNIDTEAEGDEDKARRDELRTAFEAAGLYA